MKARHAMFPIHPAYIRFGWSHAQPPLAKDYSIELSPALVDVASFAPKQPLVKQIVDNLEGLDKPRFVLLNGLRKSLNFSREAAITFQQKLCLAVREMLLAKASPMTPRPEYNMDVEDMDGYASARELTEISRSARKLPYLHWDGFMNSDDQPINSLLYGPNHNIEGGQPLLADYTQWLRDKHCRTPDQLSPQENGQLVLDHQDELHEKYTIQVPIDAENDLPLLLFNHTMAQDGVLHSATPATKKEGTQTGSRPLYRSALFYISPS